MTASACVLLVVCTLSQSQFSHISLCMHVVAFALIRRVFGSALLACARFLSCMCSLVGIWVGWFALSLHCIVSVLGVWVAVSACALFVVCTLLQSLGDPYQLVHFVAYALIHRVCRVALSACARFLSCLCSIV